MFDRGGLREFVAVVEQGSFTAAADLLDVSTSFVSREVKRLEEQNGTRFRNRWFSSEQMILVVHAV